MHQALCGNEKFPLQSARPLYCFSGCKIAFSTSKTLMKDGVDMIAGYRKRSRPYLDRHLRVVQGVFIFLCSWGNGTMQQQSYTAEVCKLWAPCLLPCPWQARALACPHFDPLLCWQARSQGKIWSSHNVYLWWVFNIATIMCLEHPVSLPGARNAVYVLS